MCSDASTVTVRNDDTHVDVTVVGDLDLRTVPRLSAALRAVSIGGGSLGAPQEVLLAFRDVGFSGAAALGVFASASARLQRHGCWLRLRGMDRWQGSPPRTAGLQHLLCRQTLSGVSRHPSGSPHPRRRWRSPADGGDGRPEPTPRFGFGSSPPVRAPRSGRGS